MVIDTSAVLAILGDEPERQAFNKLIASAERRLMSSGSYLETSIVIEARYGYEGLRDLQFFLNTADIRIVPFDVNQAEAAKQAYRLYGKGNHPAALNFGDCFAYALAKVSSENLLFKGNDFSNTDISPC